MVWPSVYFCGKNMFTDCKKLNCLLETYLHAVGRGKGRQTLLTRIKATKVRIFKKLKIWFSLSVDRCSSYYLFLKKWAKPFCLFSFLSHDKNSTSTINDKSVDGVLGTRTRGSRMVGADKSTELWRRPHKLRSKYISYFYIMPTRLDTFLTAK